MIGEAFRDVAFRRTLHGEGRRPLLRLGDHGVVHGLARPVSPKSSNTLRSDRSGGDKKKVNLLVNSTLHF